MYKIIKRSFDIAVALIILIIFLPFFLIIMLLLKFSGEGEVFYLQKRIGFKNSTFNIVKFATMLKNSPNMGTGSLTLRNDPRVTHMGKFLRITKLNEFPQIINVLKGDMSLVGPRPQMKVDFEAYPLDVQKSIYNVVPGITGIGSIIFRDEEKMLSAAKEAPKEYYRNVIAPYKGELEMWYQANASVWVDLKIMFFTAVAIFFPENDFVYKTFKGLPKSAEISELNVIA